MLEAAGAATATTVAGAGRGEAADILPRLAGGSGGLRERNVFGGRGFLRGRQAFLIFPLVEESEKIDAKAALVYASKSSGNDGGAGTNQRVGVRMVVVYPRHVDRVPPRDRTAPGTFVF